MWMFGDKGTLDGLTFLEVNRFSPRNKNKVDIEFDVYTPTAYIKREKRVANLVETVNNISLYAFKYDGLNYQLKINQNYLGN